MIDATLTNSHNFRSAGSEWSYKFTVTNVAAGATSDEIRFALPFAGMIRGFRIACGSTDFDFSLRTESGASLPAISEIMRIIDTEERYDGSALEIIYVTPDEADYLYGVVTNADGVNATGPISIEFIVGKM